MVLRYNVGFEVYTPVYYGLLVIWRVDTDWNILPVFSVLNLRSTLKKELIRYIGARLREYNTMR